MILAAGLTPAWQQIIVLDRLVLGEVNRAREVHRCASGKVLNVAIALGRLGGPCAVLSVLGGRTGEEAEREVASLGLEGSWVRASRPTRVCTTLVDRSSGLVTELVENAGSVSAEEIREFVERYEALAGRSDAAVLTGSLPQGSPATLYRDLVERGRCPQILDARGPELLEALAAKPLVVKPNREELARTLGRRFETWGDLLRAAEDLRERGAAWAVITGGREPVLVSGPGGARVFRPPRVSAVNPIGSGDCLAAGLAWALGRGAAVPEAVRFGMGAAAENAAALLSSRVSLDSSRRLAGEVVEESPPSAERPL